MERQQRSLDNHGLSFDGSSTWNRDHSVLGEMSPYGRNTILDISRANTYGFSQSLGDLSSLGSKRKTVMFEEDLRTHSAILERARSRFRELELKYPEVFRNSTRASSLHVARDSSSLKQPSIELSFHHCESENQSKDHDSEVDVKEVDQLGDLSNLSTYRKHSVGQHRKAPLLSSSMRSHHLEDSCDSAFDEIDRESNHSRSSHDQSPNNVNVAGTINSRFLYPGDSLESDKDSGISTEPYVDPATKLPIYPKRALSLDRESSTISKSLSLSQPSLERYSVVNDANNLQKPKATVSRQGILKSSAFRNQGIKSESLDAEFPLDRVSYKTKADRLRALKTGSEVYRRSVGHIPSYVSQDGTDSDAETVYSVRSEVIVRPKISARQQYLSTYGLNRITDENHNIRHNKLVKSKSLPNLGHSQSFDEATGFSGAFLACDNPKRRKKRILQRFGRRSGLYVVNDVPALEKPKLPFSSSSSSKKKQSRLRKSSSLEPTHVNETSKRWFDHTTAVSRPSNGQVLGRIVKLREDLGMAYEIELQRPNNGLFGFFIQKGYKHCRQGVFISRIMDGSSAKFLAGLLNPGDELLEVNGESTKTKTVAGVQNVMAHCDKLLLTVMPYISRKDW